MVSFARPRRSPRSPLAFLTLAVVALWTLPLAARADDFASVAHAGVGRLSLVEGSVSIGRGDAGASAPALLNAPVLDGDYVTTGARSLAEMQFDGTTLVRLSENVQLRVPHLAADDRRLQLAAGTIDLRLLRGVDGSSAVDTPSVSVIPRESGTYRVTVDDTGVTYITVRDGHADIDTPQGTQTLVAGTTLVAQGPSSNPQITTRDAIADDGFDAFNRDRDRQQLAALEQTPAPAAALGGASDLGAYGSWVDDGTSGQVWIPAGVGPGWAPYQNGSWVVLPVYGSTWIAAEPWGWAPYHYGSWYFSANYHRWAWAPPAIGGGYARPAWHATVAFGARGAAFARAGVPSYARSGVPSYARSVSSYARGANEGYGYARAAAPSYAYGRGEAAASYGRGYADAYGARRVGVRRSTEDGGRYR